MTIFKAFLKIVNKNKWFIIMYSAILILFGGMNMQTSEKEMNFEVTKPDIYIVNNNQEEMSNNFVNYLKKTCNVIPLKEDTLEDALFYRDISSIITIPKNYSQDFLEGKSPKIEMKNAGDYESSLAQMIVKRYNQVANSYLPYDQDQETLTRKINETLEMQAEIELTSKRDVGGLTRVATYYSFSNYTILAGCIYIICLVLSSFKEEKVQKRTMISSMEEKKFSRILLLSNCLFAFILWFFYVALSFIIIGSAMWSIQGLLCILNSFIFSICAVTIAFFISSLVKSKNAINGIVNVVALGSSFLCGAFVPAELLPDFVLKIAHILPSYYFISNNTTITKLESFTFQNIKPVLLNEIMLIVFIFLFIFLSEFVKKQKQKIA